MLGGLNSMKNGRGKELHKTPKVGLEFNYVTHLIYSSPGKQHKLQNYWKVQKIILDLGLRIVITN